MSFPAAIHAWFKSWALLCLLRRAPQDDPRSPVALAVALAFYASVSLLQARVGQSWPVALGMMATDLLVLTGVTSLALRLTGFGARLIQTLTALAGAGGVLGIAALPLMQALARTTPSERPAAALVTLWLFAMVWSIAVPAHIYRHALSTRFWIGAALAVLQVLVLFELVDSLWLATR